MYTVQYVRAMSQALAALTMPPPVLLLMLLLLSLKGATSDTSAPPVVTPAAGWGGKWSAECDRQGSRTAQQGSSVGQAVGDM
jgi:hypothetical protein